MVNGRKLVFTGTLYMDQEYGIGIGQGGDTIKGVESLCLQIVDARLVFN